MQNSTLAMRFLDDLIAIWVTTIALLVAILLAPNNPARIVLGLPFVLFFPGYVLIAALYPRRSDLDDVERLALSLGLSLAVVPLIGLVLNYTPWGIRLTPILLSLALFIAVCSATAVRQRMRHSAAERFAGDIRPLLQAARGLPWVSLALASGVIGVLLFAGFRFGVLGGSRLGETFTEFYVWRGFREERGPRGIASPGAGRRPFPGDATRSRPWGFRVSSSGSSARFPAASSSAHASPACCSRTPRWCCWTNPSPPSTPAPPRTSCASCWTGTAWRSEEHTSELQSPLN